MRLLHVTAGRRSTLAASASLLVGVLALLASGCGGPEPRAVTPSATAPTSAATAAAEPGAATAAAKPSTGPAPPAVPSACSHDSPKIQVALSADEERFQPSTPLSFAPGSSRLASGSNLGLELLAEHLTRFPVYDSVAVAVHLDPSKDTASGDAARDQALTQQRADAIRSRLIQRGVASNRLVAIGYGAHCSARIDESKSMGAIRFVSLRFQGHDRDAASRLAGCKEAYAAGVAKPAPAANAPESSSKAECELPLDDLSKSITEEDTTPFDIAVNYSGYEGRRRANTEEYRRAIANAVARKRQNLCEAFAWNGKTSGRKSAYLHYGRFLDRKAYWWPQERLALRRRAVTAIRAALAEQSPANQQTTRVLLGKLYAVSKRYDDAERELRRVLDDGCNLSAMHTAHSVLGRIRLSQGRAHREQLEAKPRPGTAPLDEAQRGKLEAAMKQRWVEAEQEARKALALHDKYQHSEGGPEQFLALPWCLLGHALDEQERRDEAGKAFDQCNANIGDGRLKRPEFGMMLPDWWRSQQ